MTATQHADWRNPRILLCLSLIFLCGAISGAAVSRFTTPPRAMGPTWKEGGKEISLARFKKELNLNDKQSEEIETVLDDFVMYYQMLESQMDEVRASGKSRIRQILTDEQRPKFEKMLNEVQQRAK